MPGEQSLVDANILVYALFSDVEHHARSRVLLESADDPQAQLFFSIVTNPKRVSRARTSEDAAKAVETILSLPGLAVLPTPTDAPERWVELVRRRPVVGGKIFDVQLVATMLANNIRRIYTFNTEDFAPFAELEVLVP